MGGVKTCLKMSRLTVWERVVVASAGDDAFTQTRSELTMPGEGGEQPRGWSLRPRAPPGHRQRWGGGGRMGRRGQQERRRQPKPQNEFCCGVSGFQDLGRNKKEKTIWRRKKEPLCVTKMSGRGRLKFNFLDDMEVVVNEH